MNFRHRNKKISLMVDEELSPKGKKALENHIRSLPVPNKLELAVKGNKEARMILAKDGNRMIARAVITSPRLSDEELVTFAQSPTVNEEILRYIAGNNKMTGNHSVVIALCNNPRTPVGTVFRFLPRLDIRELKSISTNKNVPAAVAAQAKRIITQKLS
jgi:hypothetical protein